MCFLGRFPNLHLDVLGCFDVVEYSQIANYSCIFNHKSQDHWGEFAVCMMSMCIYTSVVYNSVGVMGELVI